LARRNRRAPARRPSASSMGSAATVAETGSAGNYTLTAAGGGTGPWPRPVRSGLPQLEEESRFLPVLKMPVHPTGAAKLSRQRLPSATGGGAPAVNPCAD
jgi:hypothetical protein